MNPAKSPSQQTTRTNGCSRVMLLAGLVGLAILAIVFLVMAKSILTAMGNLIITSDAAYRSDAIVVLSGGGTPRLQEAARLHLEGLAPFVILTETGGTTESFGSISDIEKEQLAEFGVTPTKILVTERHVDSTQDEARVIHKLMNNKAFKSIIVVTDPYHCLRTRMIFTDELQKDGLIAYIRPVRDHWYKADTWWKTPEGWQITISEYIKLITTVFVQKVIR